MHSFGTYEHEIMPNCIFSSVFTFDDIIKNLWVTWHMVTSSLVSVHDEKHLPSFTSIGILFPQILD